MNFEASSLFSASKSCRARREWSTTSRKKANAIPLAKLRYELAHMYELVRDVSNVMFPELEGQEYAVHLVHVPVGETADVLQVQFICQNGLVVFVKTNFLRDEGRLC